MSEEKKKEKQIKIEKTSDDIPIEDIKELLGVVNKEIPARVLAVGVPAEIKKELSPTGKFVGKESSGAYVRNGAMFKKLFEDHPEFK